MINYHISFAINFIYRLDGLINIYIYIFRTPTNGIAAESDLENDWRVCREQTNEKYTPII